MDLSLLAGVPSCAGLTFPPVFRAGQMASASLFWARLGPGGAKDWPRLRLAEEQLAASFAGGRNVGILTGRASGGLVDVDCDWPEAVATARSAHPKPV